MYTIFQLACLKDIVLPTVVVTIEVIIKHINCSVSQRNITKNGIILGAIGNKYSVKNVIVRYIIYYLIIVPTNEETPCA